MSRSDFITLLNNLDKQVITDFSKEISRDIEYLRKKSNEVRERNYSNKVYMRGLIEFTNYCVKDCYYCGIRKSNDNVERYRLTLEQVLKCCEEGYRLGYRTFVLQGGEDAYFDENKIVEYIKAIKGKYSDCAITLSVGEWSKEAYKSFKEAGADRYLLRHETANHTLYKKLHPKTMLLDERLKSLNDLKGIGFQVGAGFMVGLPSQTNEEIVDDLLFLKELSPHMVGIGPFIPQKDTPLGEEKSGTLEKTCILLSIIRLMLPEVLLPATTALGSINPTGREQGLKSGANVVMPNLSPTNIRELYALYDGKICTGDEAAHCRNCIEGRINNAGFEVDMSRGDHINVMSGEK